MVTRNGATTHQLAHLLSRMAGAHGDRPALTFKGTTLTYAQLWREVRAVACGFARLGVRRGDRVAVYLDKQVETVTAIFGASAAGAVFVPVNPLLRPGQVGHALADCGARVLVTSAPRLVSLQQELADCKSVEQVVLADSGSAPATGTPYAVTGWDDLRALGAAMGATVDAAGDAPVDGIDLDAAAILYTSGSTGRPKGVVLSHRNLLAGAESVSAYLRNCPDDVLLAALPLSFDAGFSQLTTGFHAGAEVVLVNYLVPADVIQACARHRVTGLTCVPPLWIQLADQAWPPPARQLRYFANTGGRLPRATLGRLRALFPDAAPYLMYGLTEAFRSTYLDPGQVDRRPDSIGRAIPNAEILVVRPDGTACEPGEPGELVHRGALVAMGYWNDPERTAERFRPAPGRPDGWCLPEPAVWSGDTVVRDEEGFLYFVGRRDEMIKTSGYRVSPTEVEEAAYDTGLVREAVALGVDDAALGQRIVLVVSLRDPAGGDPGGDSGGDPRAELLARLRGQLPRYQVPREVVVAARLPRSPNGKLDRGRVREELTA